MPSLLAKFSFLLLFAALLGGAVGWWLARWQLEAVTAEHTRGQEEWRQWRGQMERRLAERPEPDWTPVLHRLSAMERAIGGIRLPMPESTNLRPVLDAIASVRVPPAPSVNLEPLNARLLALEDVLRRSAPAAVQTPDWTPDWTPVMARLGMMDNTLRALHTVQPATANDLAPLVERLALLEQAVLALRAPPA